MPDDKAEKSNLEPPPQPSTVVHGNVTAGRDFVGRDQVTNQTFVGKLIVSPWAWVLGFLAIAIAVVLVGAVSNARQIQSLLPTPLPFAPAKEGQSLIIVADFDNQSDGKYKGVEPAQYIYDQLSEQARQDNLNVRVERLHEVLNEQTARRSGEIYNATLLLWGWYDSLTVKPVIERIKKATYEPRAGAERLSMADPDRVEPIVTRILPGQTSFLIVLSLGLEQYSRGNLTETLRYFDTILTTAAMAEITTTSRGEVYFWRGTARHDRGDYDQAIEDYDQAIVHKPDDAMAYNNRGTAHYDRGDYDRAIDDFEQAIRLKPNYAEPHNNRARILYLRQEWAGAIAEYQKAVELLPAESKFHFNLGLAYERAGNYPASIQAYQKSLELDPGFAPAYNNLGFTYLLAGQLTEARQVLEKAITLDPNFPNPYKNLGRVYLRQNEPSKAVAELQKAMELSDDGIYPEAQYYLAEAYRVLGQTAEACQSLQHYNSVAAEDEPERVDMARKLTNDLQCP